MATGRRKAPERRQPSRWWYALLALPFIFLLYPPLYTSKEPVLFGFPFFYWYQFAWVVLGAVLTGIVYRKTRSRR